MIFLILFLIGPIILGVKLLGASWLLAVFVGVSLPLTVLVGVLVIGAMLEASDHRKQRKKFAAMQAEREIRRAEFAAKKQKEPQPGFFDND